VNVRASIGAELAVGSHFGTPDYFRFFQARISCAKYR
jgi:hypothetical protein